MASRIAISGVATRLGAESVVGLGVRLGAESVVGLGVRLGTESVVVSWLVHISGKETPQMSNSAGSVTPNHQGHQNHFPPDPLRLHCKGRYKVEARFFHIHINPNPISQSMTNVSISIIRCVC